MIVAVFVVKGQSVSTEISAMESSYYISGSLGLSLTKNGKFGFSSALRGGSDYRGESINLLAISSFSYNLLENTKVTFGGVYSNFGGFVPSVGMQYYYTKRNYALMSSPMVCGWEAPQMMVLGMAQYAKPITGKTGFSLKVITMNMFNFDEHFFSTARFRFGLKQKRFQYGIGFDLDFIGSSFYYSPRNGIFIQYQIL